MPQLAMWRVMVGGRVMWGHPSTNHNSPCGELWHKLCIVVVALDFPFESCRNSLQFTKFYAISLLV